MVAIGTHRKHSNGGNGSNYSATIVLKRAVRVSESNLYSLLLTCPANLGAVQHDVLLSILIVVGLNVSLAALITRSYMQNYSFHYNALNWAWFILFSLLRIKPISCAA
jgi:hypothetical protein